MENLHLVIYSDRTVALAKVSYLLKYINPIIIQCAILCFSYVEILNELSVNHISTFIVLRCEKSQISYNTFKDGFRMHHLEKFFQQYIVHIYVKVEDSRLYFIRSHLKECITDSNKVLMNFINTDCE